MLERKGREARRKVAWIFGATLRQARPAAGVDKSGGGQKFDTSDQRRRWGRLREPEALKRVGEWSVNVCYQML